MIKQSDHQHFFLYHLYDEVQQKYGLTDEEMDRLVDFIKRFHGQNASQALKQIRKKKNKSALDQIVQELTGKQLQEDAAMKAKFDPVTSRDPLMLPIGLPLSKDMLIEPHYEGGYGHAAQ